MLTIRPITKDDIPSCLDIYNYEVVNGVATLDLEPRTLPEWQEWYEAHQTQEHLHFAGLIDDVVVGYASLSPYRTKDASKAPWNYLFTFIKIIEVRAWHLKLMAHILEHAKETETLHTVVSVITAGNAASTALHERFDLPTVD